MLHLDKNSYVRRNAVVFGSKKYVWKSRSSRWFQTPLKNIYEVFSIKFETKNCQVVWPWKVNTLIIISRNVYNYCFLKVFFYYKFHEFLNSCINFFFCGFSICQPELAFPCHKKVDDLTFLRDSLRVYSSIIFCFMVFLSNDNKVASCMVVKPDWLWNGRQRYYNY